MLLSATIHFAQHVLHVLDTANMVPGIPSDMVARDAVDCFLELFELEGISLQPDIPAAGINRIFIGY